MELMTLTSSTEWADRELEKLALAVTRHGEGACTSDGGRGKGLFPAGMRSRVKKFGLKYLRMLHKLGISESGF